jgi:hypothetical protein
MTNNEPNYFALAASVARTTVARLEAKSEYSALTFGESKALRHARRVLAA